MPPFKELRWRGRDEVLVRLIERVRVADDLESIPNAGVARRRNRAVIVPVRPEAATGRLMNDHVRGVVVTRRDAEHGHTECTLSASEHKKAYYPTRRDEEAVNPDGTRLR